MDKYNSLAHSESKQTVIDFGLLQGFYQGMLTADLCKDS